jgi:hypothetical protein
VVVCVGSQGAPGNELGFQFLTEEKLPWGRKRGKDSNELTGMV